MGSGYCFYMANQDHRNIETYYLDLYRRYFDPISASLQSARTFTIGSSLPTTVLSFVTNRRDRPWNNDICCIGVFICNAKTIRLSGKHSALKENIFEQKLTLLHFLEHFGDIRHHSPLYYSIFWICGIREAF